MRQESIQSIVKRATFFSVGGYAGHALYNAAFSTAIISPAQGAIYTFGIVCVQANIQSLLSRTVTAYSFKQRVALSWIFSVCICAEIARYQMWQGANNFGKAFLISIAATLLLGAAVSQIEKRLLNSVD